MAHKNEGKVYISEIDAGPGGVFWEIHTTTAVFPTQEPYKAAKHYSKLGYEVIIQSQAWWLAHGEKELEAS